MVLPSARINIAVNLTGLDQDANSTVEAVSRETVVGTSVIQGPAGPQGDEGPQGDIGATGPANSLSIGTVTNGTAGASITGTAPTQTLNLVLPTGATGATGQAATIAAGTTTTGAPGSSASVVNTGSSNAATFNFTIPRGDIGATGPTGATGAAGVTTVTYDARDYGALGNAIRKVGVTVTTGSKNVSVPTASFVSGDVGKKVVVFNAYNQNFTNSTIATVTDATHIVMADNSALTLANAGYIIYGTDDTAALQATLTAAGAAAGNILTGSGVEFYPTSSSPLVTFSSRSNTGFYIITSQLNVPAGVRLDSQGMLLNLLPSKYTACVLLNQKTEVVSLRIDAMYGNGVTLGYGSNTDAYSQSIKIQSIDVRRVGFGDDGSGNYLAGLHLIGHSFQIDEVYIQGGQRSIWLDRASDLSLGRAFLVGAKSGIWAERSNQVSLGEVFLDTIGDDAETTYGLYLDYNCSGWTGRLQTFTSVDALPIPKMTSVVSVGAATSNISVGINLEVYANNSGGSVLSIAHLRDSTFKISAQNSVATLGGATNPITTAVVYGTDLAGSVGSLTIIGTYSTSVTPSSGTQSGAHLYTQGIHSYLNGLVLAAGTTVVAPLTLTAGTSLTTPVSGSIEYDGSNFFLTNSTPTRRTVATLNATETFSNHRITLRTSTLTDGATITPGGDSADLFKITLGGNRTMAAPSGTPTDGQRMIIRVIQDATGTRTLTWNAIYNFPGGAAPLLSTAANAIDHVIYQYNAGATKWDMERFIPSTGRVTRRTGTTTSSATPTINTDNIDFYSLTAQAVDITSFTTNLSGTPTEGQTLWIAITGTAARAITWGSSFEASTIALPVTTVTTARLDVGFVWNTVTSKWRVVAVC